MTCLAITRQDDSAWERCAAGGPCLCAVAREHPNLEFEATVIPWFVRGFDYSAIRDAVYEGDPDA